MADKKIIKKVTKPKEVDKQDAAPLESRDRWDMSRLFWGLLLVLIGVLVLVDNLGIVNVNLANVWQLWPLLVIGWGVSLLRIPGRAWRVALAALMIASLVLVAWAAVTKNDTFINTRRSESRDFSENIAVESKVAKNLDVTIESGAGDVTLGESDGQSVEAKLESGFANLSHRSRTDGDTQRVVISTRNNGTMMWRGDMHNELTVNLPKEIASEITVRSGASDVAANLSDLNVRKFVLDTGASSVDITLGSIANEVDVKLSAGASSIVLRVPKESGVRVAVEKGLSSQNLEGLSSKGDGIYESDNYGTATKTIHVTGSLGVASLELVRY